MMDLTKSFWMRLMDTLLWENALLVLGHLVESVKFLNGNKADLAVIPVDDRWKIQTPGRKIKQSSLSDLHMDCRQLEFNSKRTGAEEF
ncbi:hypothetical protein PR048_000958 [Dryococelus australis]|uniref:Uncharacterized protein n=1 Tax=Dryococelus australis TaxID=614101 RepID=A0ABQ9IG22_9NEOP|nr:hypothetical protein PR048_000958 [Dryococelus australis]